MGAPFASVREAGRSSPRPPSPSSPSPPSSSSPNPPSLEAILAASSDEPTDSQGWSTESLDCWTGVAGRARPCLVGAAFMMLSPGAPPLALLPLGRTDTTAPPAAPAISAARGNRVASEEPRASTPAPHHAAALPEPVASPLPAPVVAADPAPALQLRPPRNRALMTALRPLSRKRTWPPQKRDAALPEPVAPPLPPAPGVAASPARLGSRP
jgi:hypothetical protein